MPIHVGETVETGAEVILGSGTILNLQQLSSAPAVGASGEVRLHHDGAGILGSLGGNTAVGAGIGVAVDRGYVIGGMDVTPTLQTVAEALLFSVDTTSVIAGAALPVARKQGTGITDFRSSFFYAGGYTTTAVGSATTAITKTVYHSETTSAHASVLSVAAGQHVGHGTWSGVGYICGGMNASSALITTIDRIATATEAVSTMTLTLLTAKRTSGQAYDHAGQLHLVEGSTASGGGSPSISTEVLSVYTDTIAAGSSTTVARQSLNSNGAGPPAKGYVGGGQEGGVSTKIKDITFATATWGTLAATLSVEGETMSSLTSGFGNGYRIGGRAAGFVPTTVADKLDFATETVSTPAGAALSLAKYAMGHASG